MNLSKIKNLLFGLTLIFFIGCEEDQGETGAVGPNGLNSLVILLMRLQETTAKTEVLRLTLGLTITQMAL